MSKHHRGHCQPKTQLSSQREGLYSRAKKKNEWAWPRATDSGCPKYHVQCGKFHWVFIIAEQKTAIDPGTFQTLRWEHQVSSFWPSTEISDKFQMLLMPFLAFVFVEGNNLFYPKRVHGLITRMLGRTQSGCNGPLRRELKITPESWIWVLQDSNTP